MDKLCEKIRDRLVDYADGELPPNESTEVRQHLGECEKCRETVARLQRSLHAAQAIWLDNLQGSRTKPAGLPVRRPAVRWLRHAAIAASILIAIGGVLMLSSIRRTSERAPTYAEIEQQISRAAAAARLLTATQILATCEGTESIVEQQYRYILSNYADTPVAARLRTANPLNPGETEYD
jgi:anti-sigma factor RsiW